VLDSPQYRSGERSDRCWSGVTQSSNVCYHRRTCETCVYCCLWPDVAFFSCCFCKLLMNNWIILFYYWLKMTCSFSITILFYVEMWRNLHIRVFVSTPSGRGWQAPRDSLFRLAWALQPHNCRLGRRRALEVHAGAYWASTISLVNASYVLCWTREWTVIVCYCVFLEL